MKYKVLDNSFIVNLNYTLSQAIPHLVPARVIEKVYWLVCEQTEQVSPTYKEEEFLRLCDMLHLNIGKTRKLTVNKAKAALIKLFFY